MIFLAISIGLLGAGPGFYRLGVKYSAGRKWLERSLLVLVATIVVFHLIPDAWNQAGWWAIGAGTLGAMIPAVVEHYWHKIGHKIHWGQAAIAFLGLGLHSFGDGSALGMPDFGATIAGATVLQWSILLHRLPVAILIWWTLYPVYGWKLPTITLVFIGLATIIGYATGNTGVLLMSDSEAIAIYQAFIAGTLLHLAWH